MCVAKTKVLISFTVTAKLICIFVFTYENCWFPHDVDVFFLFFFLFIYIIDLFMHLFIYFICRYFGKLISVFPSMIVESIQLI